MAIATDIAIDSSGNVYYTGAAHGAAGAGYYTVIELHRFIGDLLDDAVASGDDILDITFDTASDRSTDNIISIKTGYRIDDANGSATDAISEHLYDGSIIQEEDNTIYDGVVNFGVEGIHIELMQNGALITDDFWNTIPNGETLKGLNRDVGAGISHRFMVKVRDAGVDIDGRRLLGMNREFGFTYGEFPINGTSRGNNVLALTHSTDLNNQTISGTVATWTSITNVTEGYANIDVDNDSVDEFYYSEWSKDTYNINEFYERMKYLTARGTVETIYGLSGDIFRGITHEVTVDTISGPFTEPEAVSWTGGTGQLLATDGTSTMWIQLLTGVAPTDGQTITGATSTETADVNVTVTERPLAYPFIGASTGSAIIGGYGVGIEGTDLTASDKVFDLTNTQKVPPNYVTFTVGGLITAEDRVLVGPESAGDLDEAQLSLNTTLNTDNITTVVVTASIPTDTPSTGTIRVADDNNIFRRLVYTSYTGSTFTIDTAASEVAVPGVADFVATSATSGNNVYISYIDVEADAVSESFTSVYSSDRSLFIRVRDGGGTPIKTFETTGTLGSAGGSTTAIRTADA